MEVIGKKNEDFRSFVAVNLKQYTDEEIKRKITHNKRVKKARDYFLPKYLQAINNYYREEININDMINERKNREKKHQLKVGGIKRLRNNRDIIKFRIAKKNIKNIEDLSEKQKEKLEIIEKELVEINAVYEDLLIRNVEAERENNLNELQKIKVELEEFYADYNALEDKKNACFNLELDVKMKSKDWDYVSLEDKNKVILLNNEIEAEQDRLITSRLKITRKSQTFNSFIVAFSHDNVMENFNKNPNFREELINKLEEFYAYIGEKYNLKMHSLALHGDEGFVKKTVEKIEASGKEVKYNLHAHLVFSRENNLKLSIINPEELSNLQLEAEEFFKGFGFERGKTVGAKRLSEQEMRDDNIREKEMKAREQSKNVDKIITKNVDKLIKSRDNYKSNNTKMQQFYIDIMKKRDKDSKRKVEIIKENYMKVFKVYYEDIEDADAYFLLEELIKRFNQIEAENGTSGAFNDEMKAVIVKKDRTDIMEDLDDERIDIMLNQLIYPKPVPKPKSNN